MAPRKFYRKLANQGKKLVKQGFKQFVPAVTKAVKTVNKENKMITKELGLLEKGPVRRHVNQHKSSPRGGYAVGEKHIFRHREYVGAVLGSNTFIYTQYPIGISSVMTFPVIGQMATKFETYKIRKLRFIYEPYASNVVSSGSLGDVCMVIDYDPDNRQFTDMSQFKTYYKQMSFCPTKKRFEVFKVNSKLNPIPIKFVTHDAGLNAMNDYGSLYVGTQGTQSGLIGEIYADIEVECYVMRPDQVAPTQVFTLGGVPVGVPGSTNMYIGDTFADAIAIGANNYNVPFIGPAHCTVYASQNQSPQVFFNAPGIYRVEMTNIVSASPALASFSNSNPTGFQLQGVKDPTDSTSSTTQTCVNSSGGFTSLWYFYNALILCKTDGSGFSWVQNNSQSTGSNMQFSGGYLSNASGSTVTMSFSLRVTKLPNMPSVGNGSGIYTAVMKELNSIKSNLLNTRVNGKNCHSKEEVDSPVVVSSCDCNSIDCPICVTNNKDKLTLKLSNHRLTGQKSLSDQVVN